MQFQIDTNDKIWTALDDFFQSDKRFFIQEGGSRSGKTYTTLQYLLFGLPCNYGKVNIVREELAVLKKTAMPDFLEILENARVYNKKNHNISNSIYNFNKNVYEFFGAKEGQKLRGAKRRALYINEANEITKESFHQLNIRTDDKIIIDYNPSMVDHWIFDKFDNNADAVFQHTTYKDNSFLSPNIVKEIEILEKEDPILWKIFGLGLRGQILNSIFNKFEIIPIEEYHKLIPKATLYGLDFGWNDPMALVEIKAFEDRIYIHELLYKQHMTNDDLLAVIRNKVKTDAYIVADSSEPDRIAFLKANKVKIVEAKKGPNSVVDGINTMKNFSIFVTSESYNTKEELRKYKWKEDRLGNVLDVPVDLFNHLIDASRYAITDWSKPKTGINRATIPATRPNRIKIS